MDFACAGLSVDSPTSASWVAGISGMYHNAQQSGSVLMHIFDLALLAGMGEESPVVLSPQVHLMPLVSILYFFHLMLALGFS
jgi:hypothetical protein